MLTESQGCLELPHPDQTRPQNRPVCLGLRQATFNPIWQLGLPPRAVSLKAHCKEPPVKPGNPGPQVISWL